MERGEKVLDEMLYRRLSHYKKKPHLQKTITHTSCLLLLRQWFQSITTIRQHETTGDTGPLSHASLFWSPAFSTYYSEGLF